MKLFRQWLREAVDDGVAEPHALFRLENSTGFHLIGLAHELHDDRCAVNLL